MAVPRMIITLQIKIAFLRPVETRGPPASDPIVAPSGIFLFKILLLKYILVYQTKIIREH